MPRWQEHPAGFSPGWLGLGPVVAGTAGRDHMGLARVQNVPAPGPLQAFVNVHGPGPLADGLDLAPGELSQEGDHQGAALHHGLDPLVRPGP
jgi:hypothetical protein